MNKKDVMNFNFEEFKRELNENNEPAYRAEQIFCWIYKKGAGTFDEMKNLPKALRLKLDEHYCIGKIELLKHLKSADGTEKFVFRLGDGNLAETVLIFAGQRKTVCLSTQVGCKYRCAFCASGRKGFIRNLTASEIISQILFLCFYFKRRITNYVFMGMGEPLDNYDNLRKAILIMNDSRALDIGARKITISTSGIVEGIEKLKDLGPQINLSVSLHAADDILRNRLMPVNRKYGLKRLIAACENFIEKTGRIITLEYVLIKRLNDSSGDIDGLAVIARRLNAKVNLIPYSFVPFFNFESPAEKQAEDFAAQLKMRSVKVTLRRSRGKDIHAACGQLAGGL